MAIDFATNKYIEDVDPDGLAVTPETSACTVGPGCLAWCVDGSAAWWSVELGKLHYLTGVTLVDSGSVVTLTGGMVDFSPFDMAGSRNGRQWINIYRVSFIIIQ